MTRLLHLFDCESIVIGKEPPIGDNRRIHVGVSKKSASKNTFRAYIHKAFPELEKGQLDRIARKSWTPIFQSVKKVGDTFTIWKSGTPPAVIVKEKRACASQQKRNQRKQDTTMEEEKEREGMANRNPTRRVTREEIFALLRKKKNWSEVVHDPILGPRLINNYLNIQNVYVDLRISKMKKELEEKGLRFFNLSVVLLCYRVIYLDKTLASRLTVIFLMYLILGSLAFFFGGLNFKNL